MAVRSTTAKRANQRVVLTRSGGKRSPGKNRRMEQKAPRHISVPWDGIKNFFSTGFAISVVIFLVVAVGAALFYTYNRMTAGEYFALKTLKIQGNSRLSSREILETADLTDGGNTLALSIDTVEDALSRHPWVQNVSVKRVLPGTLIIEVEEKTPAFWVLHNGALQYADAWGNIIAPVIPGKFASLPTLEVEAGAEDSATALPDLIKSFQDSRLPLKMASVSMVRLSSARGMEVYVDDSRLKLSIGLEEWLPNLSRLSRTLEDLVRRKELESIKEIKAQGANVWVEKRTPSASGA